MITSQDRIFKKSRSRDILDFISIRAASGIDDDEIGDLLARTFSLTHAEKLPHAMPSPDRVAELRDVKRRRENGRVVVLELGYRIIGTFALIHPESKISDSWLANGATLRCVAVDPEFHGLGFSTALLAESEELAKSWGVDYICLHVQQGAHGVAKLYQGRGYIREPRGDLRSHGHVIEGYYLPLDATKAQVGATEANL